MKTNIVIDVLPPIPISSKILLLELLAKMPLANQIARFFKR